MLSGLFHPARPISAIVVLLSLARIAAADTADPDSRIGASVTVASDHIFRGVSQTLGRPALQASLDLQLSERLYAYAWGSNVDFRPDGEPDDGARQEIDLAIGYAARIGRDWIVDIAAVRYLFPGTTGGVDYDYTELVTAISWHERLRATVAFARDVEGSGADSWYAEAAAAFDIPSAWNLEVALGHYDLSAAYGNGYSYASAMAHRSLGATTLGFSVHHAFNGADRVYYPQAAGSRVVLSVRFDL